MLAILVSGSVAARPFAIEEPPPVRGQLASIAFAPGSSGLHPEALAELAEVAELLAACPDHMVVLEGYDDRHPEAEPQDRALGARRAERVRSALFELGIEPYRIVIVSHAVGGAEQLEPGPTGRVIVRTSLWPYTDLLDSQRDARPGVG